MEFFKSIFDKFPLLKNRYFLVLLVFAVWIFLFDIYKVPLHAKYWIERDNLEESVAKYEAKISEAEQLKKELFKDEKTLEKFAREEYRMKRKGEDVYIIDEPEGQ